MHEGSGAGLLSAIDLDALCSECHEGGLGSGFADPTEVIWGPRGHEQAPLGRCVDCHRAHPRPLGSAGRSP